ncbi:MAG: adenylate/guanylate cyclase domain-containing protein [Myxococcaceae bacterium]|nr:adenylate/guanylate cyclase domain-containing protein [Myxococcaceae bacterium]
MPAPAAPTDADFEALLSRNVNEAMARGALGASVLGYVSTLAIAAMHLAHIGHYVYFPGVAAFACGTYSLLIWQLARKNRMRGWVLHATLLPFSLAPSAVILGAELVFPSGAATFIQGPFAMLSFVIIGVTAFAFDRKLSWASGALAGAGYLVAFAVARPRLEALSHPDPAMLQDLTLPYIFGFKALMMVFAGTISGALSTFVRKLLRRLLEEERQRSMVQRLFGEYVSDEVREKLMRESGQARGERRAVAVLFSDIRGFSTFSEAHPPEEIVSRLNAYFDRMVEAIARSGGVVDKFIGDAVMATFGGFSVVASPCDAAFAAACAMRTELERLNETWTQAGKSPFQNGIGLDFGEVVQGPLGSERRKDFTVVGDVVNTASRLEGLTKDHNFPIILSESVYDGLSAARRALCHPIGEVKVKGKLRPVKVYGAGASAEAVPTTNVVRGGW